MNSQRIDELTFEDVFDFENLFIGYRNCRKGVNWKTSTKNYSLYSIENLAKTFNQLHTNRYKTIPYINRRRTDRGKQRNIQEVHFKDRVVHKAYCDNFLVPLLAKRLIYDNGACMKGKGGAFCENRLKAHLQKFYRKNNFSNVGYILTFDFSKFFESIDHEILFSQIRKIVKDDKLFELYKYIVNCFGGNKGLGLGSQISQVSALYFTNKLDHYIKEKLKVKFYGRYMDDGYLISDSKEFLISCRDEIIRIAEELKLTINIKKTKLWKLEKGFMFLKRHWYLTQKGFVKLKPTHDSMVKTRKKYRKVVKLKGVDSDEVKRLKCSIHGHLKKFNNRRLEDYVYN